MNYRHAFHAGNFADVMKHSFMLLLLDFLCKKDKPMCYLETHAGAGRYRLPEHTAERVPEYVDGIERLLAGGKVQGVLSDYLRIVKSFNETGELIPRLRYYPGSPLLAAQVLRENDRLMLCEWQVEQAQLLKDAMHDDARAVVFQRDGYQALQALLPPNPRRGLVLIDPPYERSDEFSAALTALELALKRWPQGAFALWYPIKRRADLQPFLRSAAQLPAKSAYAAELAVHADDTTLRLNGSGMLIVNPPYRFPLEAQPLLKALAKQLVQSRYGRADWLCLRDAND